MKKLQVKIIQSLYFIFFITIILAFSKQIFSQQKTTWQQISGNWSVVTDNKESYLRENRGKSFTFDYSPLINLNSLISNNEISFSSITHTVSLQSPINDTTYLTFFAASDYRQFYAVKLDGTTTNIQRLSIIKSNIKNSTLPKQAKGNFTITTLATKEVSLAYGKTYTLTINVQGKTLTVTIDDTVLSHTLDEELEAGKIGFASKNCIPIIDNLKAFKGKDVIFEDDFSKESIRKIILQGRKLTHQEVEEHKKQKKN